VFGSQSEAVREGWSKLLYEGYKNLNLNQHLLILSSQERRIRGTYSTHRGDVVQACIKKLIGKSEGMRLLGRLSQKLNGSKSN